MCLLPWRLGAHVRTVPESLPHTRLLGEENSLTSLLLPKLLQPKQGATLGQDSAARPSRLDLAGERPVVGSDDGGEEPGFEGRGDILLEACGNYGSVKYVRCPPGVSWPWPEKTVTSASTGC